MSQRLYTSMAPGVSGWEGQGLPEEVPDDDPLLLPVMGRAWTEHSDRNWVLNAARALGFNKEWTDCLGRWRAGASDEYVRNSRLRVWHMQTTIANAIRQGRGGPDLFDEEAVLDSLREFMTKRGADEDAVRWQTDRLRFFSQTPVLSPPGVAPRPALPALPVESPAQVPIFLSGGGGPEERLESLWAGNPDEEDHAAQAALDLLNTCILPEPPQEGESRGETIPSPEDMAEEPEEERPQPRRLTADAQGYFISISARVGLRKLHKLHRCHRVPGIDYLDWEEMGLTCPAADAYDSICKDCWRPGKGAKPGDDDPAADGKEDSADAGGSSTSSSEEE